MITRSLDAADDVMQNPMDYQGQSVEVRGFLYRNQEGELILNSEPGLKSCCIHTKGHHLTIRSSEGNIQPSLQAMTLQGIVKVEASGLFFLDHAQVVTKQSYPIWLILTMMILILVFFTRKKIRYLR